MTAPAPDALAAALEIAGKLRRSAVKMVAEGKSPALLADIDLVVSALAAASERERRLEALVRDMLEAEAEAAPRDWNQRECPCDWCAQASAALDGREG